nr:hypothetical protein Iba_chr07bCG10120 [Ipomoea batatas]GMD17983.1 hypothetical protein Iba_chr07dCG8890 [Ipomoea batatas]
MVDGKRNKIGAESAKGANFQAKNIAINSSSVEVVGEGEIGVQSSSSNLKTILRVKEEDKDKDEGSDEDLEAMAMGMGAKFDGNFNRGKSSWTFNGS